MKIEFYREQDWLFSGEDGICTKIAFQDADTRSHNHNYYEFFLVGAGSATHHINDKKKIVNTGALVFIRPKDIHSFQNPSSDFSFYNLLVSRGTMDSCFSFLGTGCNADQLMENEMPPFRQLLPAELNNLLPSFEQLAIAHELNIVRFNTLLRAATVNLLTSYFLSYNLKLSHDIPTWLGLLALEMQKQQNYQEGLNALYRISQKSPEYLCRVFKKHLNKTPTEFINDIRIANAKLALEYTNRSILQICEEVGFDNTSHFYHLFKKDTGLSPKAFRELSSEVSVSQAP